MAAPTGANRVWADPQLFAWGIGKDHLAPGKGSLPAYPPVSPPRHSGLKPDSKIKGSACLKLTEYWENIWKLLLQTKDQQGTASSKVFTTGQNKEIDAGVCTAPPKSEGT